MKRDCSRRVHERCRQVKQEKLRTFLHTNTITADLLRTFTCKLLPLDAHSLHFLASLIILRINSHVRTLIMSSFHLNIGPDGVTYHGPDGWTRVGPGSWTPETIAAAANSKKNTSSADESATKNKNKQSKRYYCKPFLHIHFLLLTSDHTPRKGCYGHGYNNTHNSQQCNKRKKIADNPTHPANPIQKVYKTLELDLPATDELTSMTDVPSGSRQIG